MPFQKVLSLQELPPGNKKTVTVGETEILVVHTEEGELYALEAKCPHAGAPLEKGAVCNGKLICPWHTGTFSLASGAWIEPPPLRSLRSYRMQMEDGQIAVDPEPLHQPSMAHSDDNAPGRARGEHLHFVMIGGGAAAAAAVCTLRQGGFGGKVTVIDPRESEPVDRTSLSKMSLSGDKPLETLPLWNAREQKKLSVERLCARVDSLSAEHGTLRLNDGTTFGFDAALLATGGIAKWLCIPGEDLRHVYTLRHIRDVEGIDNLLADEAPSAHAVLLGDSFIAFEAASALRKRGLAVTVVSRSQQPFSKELGEEAAQAIVRLHEANGVVIRRGQEAQEITPAAVLLKSGESLPAKLVIVAIGVKPATDFEHDIPLRENGTIEVNEGLQARSKLWVAGDVATVNGIHIEHWRVAEQHGRAAALEMLAGAGIRESNGGFHGVPFFWTYHFGKRFAYIGHAEDWDELSVDGSFETSEFLAYYVKGGRVQAVFGCGKDSSMALLAERMHESLTLVDARAAVGHGQ